MLEANAAPILYPGLPMAKYGLIPAECGGGNKYRVIWAPSRFVTLTGRDKIMTVPMYIPPYAIEPIGEMWILEGWLSAIDFYAGTKETWEANAIMLNTGPYPSRGDYVLRAMLPGTPSDYNLDFLIAAIEEGPKRTAGDRYEAIEKNMLADIRDRKNKREALIRGSMRPYGAETYVGAMSKRNSKTYPVLKSREELGLPSQGTNAVRLKKPVIYEIPQESWD